jgi:ferredoxin-NADP reductase
MAGTALRGRLSWRLGAVVETIQATPRARTIVLDVPGWEGPLPGQHVALRLTAEDGYQAQRSYSIASAPEDARLTLTVERLEDGEVSPYLTDALRVGDKLELRGPIGGYFTWQASEGGPLLLVAGGSGIVPLMAMIRHRVAAGGNASGARSGAAVRLLYSSRSYDEIIYRDQLARLAVPGGPIEVVHTLTRARPPGWRGQSRRIDRAMLAEVGWPASDRPRIFVCGPTRLVEAVATDCLSLGHEPARIRTERFGPTGA